MKKKKYTVEEIFTIAEMKRNGATAREIAEKLGRTPKAISLYLMHQRQKFGQSAPTRTDKEPKEVQPAVAPKAKTLEDFPPREMIKHLYNLGYRIEGDELWFVQKTRVKLGDILQN